jgi:hypothetical protein
MSLLTNEQSAELCQKLVSLFLTNDIAGLQSSLRTTEFLKSNCKKDCSNFLLPFDINKLVSSNSHEVINDRACTCFRRRFIGALLGQESYEDDCNTKEYAAMRAQQLITVQALFASEDVSHEHISDTVLLDFLHAHMGWPENDKLLIFLLSVIPPARWARARTYNQGFTAMHVLAYGMLDMEMLRPHILKLLDMGCDPREQGVDETILYPFTCLFVNADMVRLLTSKYKLNVNELTYQPRPEDAEAQSDLQVSHGVKETQLMRLLKFEQYTKNEERLSQIKQVVSIVLAAGYDLTYRIPVMTAQEQNMYIFGTDHHTGEGCTTYDYVISYGWVECLIDILPVPEGHVHTPVVDEYEANMRSKRWENLSLTEMLTHCDPAILLKYNNVINDADTTWICPMIKMRHCKNTKLNIELVHNVVRPGLLKFLEVAEGKCAFDTCIQDALRYTYRNCYGFHTFSDIWDALTLVNQNHENYQNKAKKYL